jgi:hypothetical protein
MKALLEDFKNHLSFERQLSPNTVAAYGADVESFLEYCEANNKDPLLADPAFLDQYNYQLTPSWQTLLFWTNTIINYAWWSIYKLPACSAKPKR